ncbi:hypothetical protein [Methylobacterium nonmethylotrophicum]|uniref:Uncharacterized protein n=1 Tax=Methylobacterium nonmethylotrophicum TaxID=1141884 RepID=A0A4Z0P047_9HYPH|nr:hypothetical protein [Methylobacterium nonmethylotrophicum]TGE02652.1 hypothetical protein EU555_02505 [Methylobacterium nonmethylotrophicum]
MTDVITEHARADARRALSPLLAAPPPETQDPARYVGEIFKRLCGCQTTFDEVAFTRIARAVLVSLGKAALEESERQARRIRERSKPSPHDIRVTAPRQVDLDTWDPGERD